MEEILGVKEVIIRHGQPEGSEVLGKDTTIADSDYDVQGNDQARYRYQRMFWEPYAEGSVSLRSAYLSIMSSNIIV